MTFSVAAKQNLAKAAVAVAMLGGLVFVTGSQLAPRLSPWLLMAYVLAAAIAMFVVLVVVVSVVLTFRQFILRKGGTDVDWLWFPSEPKGLVRLRQGVDQPEPSRKTGD